MSRPRFLALSLAVAGFVVACTGSDPDLEGAKDGADSGGGADGGANGNDSSDTSASCDSIAGDLLSNGSFEKASTTGLVTTWTAEPALVQKSGDADACSFWAEWSPGADGYLAHELDLGTPATAGTMFEIGLSAKTLDGDADPIVVQLRVVNDTYKVGQTARLNADGTWTRLSVVLPLPVDGSKLAVEIVTDKPRKLGLDRVYVKTAT